MTMQYQPERQWAS